MNIESKHTRRYGANTYIFVEEGVDEVLLPAGILETRSPTTQIRLSNNNTLEYVRLLFRER